MSESEEEEEESKPKENNANSITISMPQRTSKILLVRLIASKNALLFQIRLTYFARYTV